MKNIRKFILAALFGTAAVNSTAQSVIAGGFCGAKPQPYNLTWYLYSDSTFVVYGSGDMDNYLYFNGFDPRPWLNYLDKIKTVIIGDSVTIIGTGAFMQCNNLTSVSIGNSVTDIGHSAFARCDSLTSITIGNSVTNIRMSAFFRCSNLSSVTIGNNVAYIASRAFYMCTKLSSLTVHAVIPPILQDNEVFDNVSDTISIYVPCGSVPAYQTVWTYFNKFIEEFADITAYSASFCQGTSYTDNNFTNLMQAGTYYDTLQNVNGCDSILELTLMVNPTYITQINDSIYIGNSYNFFGKLLVADGIYYDTLQSINSCDSIIKLTLTVTGVGIIENSYELQVTSYDIYDILGRMIDRCEVQGTKYREAPSLLERAGGEVLPAGIYIIKFQTNKGTIIKKIIK